MVNSVLNAAYVVTWTDPNDGMTETGLCDSRECANEWVQRLSAPSYCDITGEKLHDGIVATSFSRPIHSI